RVLYAGISGTGVVRSNDGGLTWNTFLNSTNPVVAAAIGPAPGGFSKVIVALPPPASPPNANGVQVIYVTFEGTNGALDPIGLFLTKNQGITWTKQAASAMPTGTQGGYSFHMAIDPASPGDGDNDIIYFGTVTQAVSTDSGKSFVGISGVHPDTHAWAFFPRPSSPNSIAYVGCDGGISSSTNGGSAWTQLNSNGIQTSLSYNLDLKPDATASFTVGALQDNELETTATASTILGWVGATGGGGPGFADGWDVAYDGQAPGVVYGSTGAWSPPPATRVFRSTNDGVLFPTNITPWTTTTDVGFFLAPIATDPSTAGIVYVSGNQNLWQSQNATAATPTWRIIGSFGGAGNVDVAPANGNNVVIAVGTQVLVSTNALAATVTFTNITRNLPGRNVARAMFDPADPTAIYAVLGGFSVGGASVTSFGRPSAVRPGPISRHSSQRHSLPRCSRSICRSTRSHSMGVPFRRRSIPAPISVSCDQWMAGSLGRCWMTFISPECRSPTSYSTPPRASWRPPPMAAASSNSPNPWVRRSQ
ncbi:MAG: hypothetical protein JO058_05775, partial [Alphaproteobacteria bacterium]|nr:hypothetical protein [Alphaproteobacteria bacterium]